MIYALGDRKPVFSDGDHFIAENAVLIGAVELHRGASVWFNAVLRGDSGTIVIGENSNIQDGCILHTHAGVELAVGKGVTVGHGAVLHGCVIGDDTLVGIGAMVLQGARVGKGCIIGAGALVTEGAVIPDNSLVLGCPGRAVKPVTDAQREDILSSSEHYVKKAGEFLRMLKRW